MKRIIVKYGLIAGLFLGTMTGVMVPVCINNDWDMWSSQVVGYSAMILAFAAVFFGIRSYRDSEGGGGITFGKAFQVGILIALVASAMYVIGWEIAYWGFIPDFGDKFAAMSMEKLRASGASAAEIAKQEATMARFKELYRNPLFNIGVTFLEVFPVGLVVTLVSAAILRKPRPAQPAAAAATA